jgi:hypothetical protein
MISTGRRARVVIAAAAAAVLGMGMGTAALAAAGGHQGSPGNSASQITGSFSSDCTDFTSTSSKDFSHIDFVFADGGTETVSQFSDTHNYNRTGDRVISTATVKAGTTSNTYSCTPDGGGGTNECNDTIDNDGFGDVDGADPDCANGGTSEGPHKNECNDTIDNDGFGDVDGADPDCANGSTSEGPHKNECNDTIDNDQNGDIDAADPQCANGGTSEGPHVNLNRCEHNGLIGLLTEEDSPTVAKAAYDAILNNVPILADPHGDGPISTPVGEGLAPLDEATGLPVALEARCAISLVDGNGAPVPAP